MALLINHRPRKKFYTLQNASWLALGALIFSSIIIFLVAGASRSTEIQTPIPALELNNVYNTYLSDEQLRNLTNEFTDSFNARVLALLQGAEAADPGALITEQLQSGVLDETLNAPIDTATIFGAEISDEDILISEDNSEAAMLSYFAELSKIITYTKGGATNALKQGAQTKDFSLFETASNLYAHAFIQTQKLIVPSFWKEIHKKEMSMMVQNKKVFQAIANVANDPVLSFRAFEHLIRLGKDGVALEQEIKIKGQQFLTKK